MNQGYVRLWRKSLDAGWIKNHKLWAFWSWCLLKASYKEVDTIVGLQVVHLMPGQFIFGRKKAARDLGLSEREIRTIIEFLKKAGNLTIKATSKFSVITIINWHTYQSDDDTNDQQTTSKIGKNDHQNDQQIFGNYPNKSHTYQSDDDTNDQQNDQQNRKKRPQTKRIYSKNIFSLTTTDGEKNSGKTASLSGSSSLSSQISLLTEKYSDQEAVSKIFEAIASTRKANRISDSVKLKILQSWEKYPEESVMAGIKIFLSMNYHKQGKRESYLLGIIRNQEPKPKPDTRGGGSEKTMVSTGSALLDEFYQKEGYIIDGA
jgi:hypothetical protein